MPGTQSAAALADPDASNDYGPVVRYTSSHQTSGGERSGWPLKLGVGTDGYAGHSRFAQPDASPMDCSTAPTLHVEPLTVQ